MEIIESKAPSAIFVIPPFRVRQVVPLLELAFLIGCAVFIPSMLGIDRTARSMAEDPELWVVMSVLLLGAIVFEVRMLLPPLSSLAKIEISHDGLRLTPDRMQRFWGDTTLEERIPAQSKEIVLRHSSSALGLTFEYSIIIRDASGEEHALKSTCLNSLNQQQSQKLAEAISAVTELPVRLAVRLRTDEGSIREIPWELAPRRDHAPLILALLGGGVIPILAGCFVGYHAVPLARAALIGLISWIGWILAFAVVNPTRRKFPFYLLSTIVTFSALYLTSVVVVEFLRAS